MTPEQQNLIKQLSQMGDTFLFNRKKETIVKAISEMDIEYLERILDDKITYQDTSKEIFLFKIQKIFEEIKKSDDALFINEGKCNSDQCTNYEKCGAMFYGNKTGKYFNLIIEEDKNKNVQDLYYCHAFKCNTTKVDSVNGKSLSIKIHDDEKANFKPNSHYNYINSKSLKAISDIKYFENNSISYDELNNWLQDYYDFFYSMSIFKLRYKNEYKFFHIYDRANDLKKYLLLEKDCSKAMQLHDSLLEDNEMNLLKWFAEHEYIKDDLILFLPEFVDEKTKRLKQIIVNDKLNISISVDYLISCIRFQDMIDTNYYKLFDKFKVEIEEEKDFTPFGDDIDKHISLNYHLMQRNIFVNEINYKTKMGKNKFLFNSDEFGKLENGVELDSNKLERGFKECNNDINGFEII
jgi:hypothetical protein